MSSENERAFWSDYNYLEKCCEVLYVRELEAEVVKLKTEVEDVRWGYKELRASIHDFFEDCGESG